MDLLKGYARKRIQHAFVDMLGILSLGSVEPRDAKQ